MSESFRQKLNGLSAVERLKATDKYLTEMRGILASMDEIAALRKQRDDNLILIETEHQMRIDSANKLAKFEEERLQQFFERANLKRCAYQLNRR